MLEEKSEKQLLDLHKEITVVIPTLNEEEGIAMVIEELHSMGLRNILVIDGYSRDKTVDIAGQHGAQVLLQHGKGKTGALKTAIDQVKTPYMLVIDGDFTYDASCIGRFMQHMELYDEVIGARVPDKKSMTYLHKIGNRIITKVFNLLMSTGLSDVCSGIYVLRTDSAKELDLSTAGFDVEAEIAAQIAPFGKIAEVPVNYRPRLGRQKLSTWKGGFRIIKSIFGLAKSYNPGVFYSMLGSLLVIPASLTLFATFLEWLLTRSMSSTWFFVGIGLLLVAIQAMSVGVVSLVMRRTELRMMRLLTRIHDTHSIRKATDIQ